MIGLIEDLRHSLLALVKNRGFALAAILSLGLGIGLNTTIFTFVNAIFLQPLPVKEPGGLASIVTLDSRIPGYGVGHAAGYREESVPEDSCHGRLL